MKDEAYVQDVIEDIAEMYVATEDQRVEAYYQLDETHALMVGYLEQEGRYTLYQIIVKSNAEGIAIEGVAFGEYVKIPMPQMIEMLRKIDKLEKIAAAHGY